MRPTKRGVLRAVLLLTLVALSLNLALDWIARRAVGRALAEAPDVKRSLADLVPPPIPRAENASPSLNAAGELCEVTAEEVSRLVVRRSRPAPDPARDAAVWSDIVRRNALALQILDASAGRDHAWFETRYSDDDPFATAIPPLAERRCLANALRARALLAAHERRPAEAYHDVLLLLRLGEWCSQESPALIDALVSIAISTIATESLEDVMSAVAPDAATVRALDERLAALRAADPVRRGLESERTAQYLMFEALVREGPFAAAGHWSRSAHGGPVVWLLPSSYLRLEQAACLRATTTMIRRCDRATFELRLSGEADEVPVARGLVMARIMLPSLSRAVASRDELRARLDLGRVALAAERYREGEGAYPPGELPMWYRAPAIDPITGAPYGYTRLASGFALDGPPGRRPALSFRVER